VYTMSAVIAPAAVAAPAAIATMAGAAPTTVADAAPADAVASAAPAPASTPSVTIRKARRKDRHGMDACNQRCLAENYELRLYDHILCTYPGVSYVCVVGAGTTNESVVGYVLCDITNVVSVAVDTAYRGKGYAREMLTRCLDACDTTDQAKPACMKLHVRVSNGVVELYKKLGFVPTKRIFAYYKNPNEDGFEMERSFSTKGTPSDAVVVKV